MTDEVVQLKAELYDTTKQYREELDKLVNMYSEALLRASKQFNLTVGGETPTSVAEFHEALDALQDGE